MKVDTNSKKLDGLISGAISREELQFDFNRWKDTHQEEIRIFESQTANRQIPRSAQPSDIWRAIMKSPVTKIAAAAVIVVVMIVLHQFAGSIRLSNTAFAEMQKAINEVPWVHVILHTVRTSTNAKSDHEFWFWFSPRRKVRIIKSDTSSQIFWSDHTKGVRQVYDPQSNTITISHEYEQLDAMKETPWSYLAPIFGSDLIRDAKIIENLEVLEGQQVRVFNLTKIEDEGVVSFRILADINNKLPMALTMEATDPNGQILSSVEGTVCYLKEGPQDIYEVGAARDAAIIDQLPSPEAEELLEICKSYRANFTSYISVILSGRPYNLGIEVDYINGDVSQAGRYYKSLTYFYAYKPDGDINLLNEEIGKGFDSLLEFIRSGSETELLKICLWEGKYSHTIRKNDSPSYQKSRSLGGLQDIYGYAWPYYQPSGKIIQNEYSGQDNLICLEAYNSLFYFDPEHDYICIRREYLDKHSDETGTYRYVQEVKEMTQTGNGWWYPCKVEWIRVNLDDDGEEISRQVNNVTEIYIKIVPEFPKGIFEAKNLPRGID